MTKPHVQKNQHSYFLFPDIKLREFLRYRTKSNIVLNPLYKSDLCYLTISAIDFVIPKTVINLTNPTRQNDGKKIIFLHKNVFGLP